jgi:hypothetical protein
MRRMCVAAALAAFLLLSAAAVANARTRIEVSTTAILLSGRLTFQSHFFEAVCDVTLHASLRRLIGKTRGEAVGAITAILTANQGFNRCQYLAGMTISYTSISGSLPLIRGVSLNLNERFALGDESFNCLFTATWGLTARENPVRRIILDPTNVTECISLRLEIVGELKVSPEVTIRLLER